MVIDGSWVIIDHTSFQFTIRDLEVPREALEELAVATMTGIVLGLALAHRYISWGVHGPWWHRALRFLIGSAVVFALNLGLKVVFLSADGTAFYLILRFLGSGIIGIWVSLGAPWIFQKLKLSKRQS